MELFHTPGSPPSRAVRMTAMAIGVPLDLKELPMMNGEHRRPDYLKITPQHSIPTLKDRDLVLWDGRAIQMYLVDRYAPDDALYPRDPAKRAVVNQRLFFDACILSHRFAEFYHGQVFGGLEADPSKLGALCEAVAMLELFLEGQPYVTGQAMTIVDISVLATVATMVALGFELKPYRNVAEWYKHMREVAPGADVNEEGAKEFAAYR